MQRYRKDEIAVKGHRLQICSTFLCIHWKLFLSVQQDVTHLSGTVDFFQYPPLVTHRGQKVDLLNPAMAADVFHAIGSPELQNRSSGNLFVNADFECAISGHQCV